MVFNYDNPKIFLGQYPQFSCGQFLINCLSLGAGICPVATDEMILSWISQDNQVSKFDYLMSSLPKAADKHWHDRFFNSIRWITNSPQALHSMNIDDHATGSIISYIEPHMRSYIDKRWRSQAIQVSNSNLGFLLPAHDIHELYGWISLFGHRKHFSVINYHKIREVMLEIKVSDRMFAKSILEMQWDYKPSGFIFDLGTLIENDRSFIGQMNEAYKFFCIGSFNELMLTTYRKAYLKSNLEFDKGKKI